MIATASASAATPIPVPVPGAAKTAGSGEKPDATPGFATVGFAALVEELGAEMPGPAVPTTRSAPAPKAAAPALPAHTTPTAPKAAGKTAPPQLQAPVSKPAPVKDNVASIVAKVNTPQTEVPAGPATAPLESVPREVSAGKTASSIPAGSEPTAEQPSLQIKAVKGKESAGPPAAAPKQPAPPPVPFLPVVIPLPPVPPPAIQAQTAPGKPEIGDPPAMAVKSDDPPQPQRVDMNDAAMEIRLRDPQQVGDAQAGAPPAGTAQEGKSVPPVQPRTQVEAHVASAEAVAAVATAPAAHPIENPARPAPESSPSDAAMPSTRATYREEPAQSRESAPQPLRSLSLEFSPDGASDVRVRLSEKAGEVHISLHSPDASLSSRLREGVHDLVGSLSSAGYDAEAWTPGQGQRNGQGDPGADPEQQRRYRQPIQEESETGSFGDLFQQPLQENL